MPWGDTSEECLEEISTSVNGILYTINYNNGTLSNFEKSLCESFRNIRANMILYIEKESIFNVKENQPVLYDLLFKLDIISSAYSFSYYNKKPQSIDIIKEVKPLLILLNRELDMIYRTKYNQNKCESIHPIGIFEFFKLKLKSVI